MTGFNRWGRALLAAAVAAACFSGCSKTLKREEAPEAAGAFTDARDGKTYKTVTVGGARWMARNLNYGSGGSWCYGNKNFNCAKYGRLYSPDAAKTACPAGWHLPSDEEWDDLAAAAGGKRMPVDEYLAYQYTEIDKDDVIWAGAGRSLKARSGWDWNDEGDADGNGTDDYGFSALPGGRYGGGTFQDIGNVGLWAVAGKSDSLVYARAIGNEFTALFGAPYFKYSDSLGISVRCVGDNGARAAAKKRPPAKKAKIGGSAPANPKPAVYGELKDARDGKTYKTLKMPDGKTWMARNLDYDTANGKGSWCYGESPDSCAKYGRLYDWKTVRRVCPAGWHLASREEWDSLAAAVGGEKVSLMEIIGYGTEVWIGAGEILKAKNGWKDAGGTDAYGFSALPGGRRDQEGRYGRAGSSAGWWALPYASLRSLYFNSGHIFTVDGHNESDGHNDDYGFSARCVMGDAEPIAYTLSLTAKTGGTVSATPDRKLYAEEEPVTITATPDSGYAFSHWMWSDRPRWVFKSERANINTDSAVTTVAMYLNMALTAWFERTGTPPPVVYGALADTRDGKEYKTVEIDGKTWMAENLKYKPAAGKSRCCGDKEANCAQYGRRYGWTAAMNACPKGWHLPTIQEWDDLVAFAGGENSAGKKLKSASGWAENGTDAYGFSAMPDHDQDDGCDVTGAEPDNRGNNGGGAHGTDFARWWTSTEDGNGCAHNRNLNWYNDSVDEIFCNKGNWFSVRCVMDGK